MIISTIGGSSNLFAAKYTKDSFTLSKSIYLVLFFDSLVTSLGFIVIQGMLDLEKPNKKLHVTEIILFKNLWRNQKNTTCCSFPYKTGRIKNLYYL